MNGIIHCNKIPDSPLGHLVVIDGKSTMTESDFLYCVGEQLDFPDEQKFNWNAYLDWMRDLSWIDGKQISIIIANFESFLCKDQNKLKYFMSDFEEIIFPFWRNDAEKVFESQNAVKDIMVYCLHNELLPNELVATKTAVNGIKREALGGKKTPHSTSLPVLRQCDGKLYFAVFVFFYNKEQMQSAMVRRPTMWVISDLRTGEIVQRYTCPDSEFSNSDYQKFYSISDKGLAPVSKFYWDSAYALMDLIRHEYVSYGTLNKQLYKEYLKRIVCSTPAEYRVFYEDLSNIDVLLNPEEKFSPDAAEQEIETSDEAAALQCELLAKLDAVQQTLVGLQQTFDEKIAEDAYKNGLFDNMHRELVQYKNGALDKVVDTIALDIIQLIDAINQYINAYEKREPTEENYSKLLVIVKGIAQDLEDILYRQSIEPYKVHGHEVDTRRQKIVQTIATADEAQDNCVAVRVADGFEKGNRVLRPERIKVFKYDASLQTQTEN